MTHYDYDDNAFDKAYKYHMDNWVPNADNGLSKPHNIIAVSLFKGFGYKMTYSNSYSVARYPQFSGWWSDNLQNKDHTLYAGQTNINDISVDKDYTSLLKSNSWIPLNQLKEPYAQKSTERMKNIYVCLFNRNRVKMTPSNSVFYSLVNVVQNNIVPIIPDLDKNDVRLYNYNCNVSTNQYAYTDISKIDNQVYTSTIRNYLYMAANLRGNAKETINYIQAIAPYDTTKYEGFTKVVDGSRFVYWNPCCGPNAFLIVDSPVNIIQAKRNDISLDVIKKKLKKNLKKKIQKKI
jgi:hypothetical protein